MEALPALRNAWTMGGHAWALGHPPSHFTTILEWRDRPLLAYAWIIGYWTKLNRRNKLIDGENFSLCFDMRRLEDMETVNRVIDLNRKRKEHQVTTRTSEELAKLREEFNGTYTGDAANADAAFADHLANLDAGEAVNAAASPAKPAKAAKAPKAAKPAKAAKAAKPAKAAKEPKAAKPKAFRPTSEDRQTFNAAAAKVAGKDVKAPRLVPAGGKATYTDFLQGKVLKLDADGSGSTVLNVVSAKDTKTVLGTVTVTVTKGKVKATGAKA